MQAYNARIKYVRHRQTDRRTDGGPIDQHASMNLNTSRVGTTHIQQRLDLTRLGLNHPAMFDHVCIILYSRASHAHGCLIKSQNDTSTDTGNC